MALCAITQLAGGNWQQAAITTRHRGMSSQRSEDRGQKILGTMN